MTDEGVVGAVLLTLEAMYRRGEDGRRLLVKLAPGGNPNIGELLRSAARCIRSLEGKSPVSLMSLNPRLGRPGKTSSAGFLGMRARFGDPTGLAGRCCGEESKWPAVLNPGID